MNLSDNDITARLRQFQVRTRSEAGERTLRDALAAQAAGPPAVIRQRRALMLKRIGRIAAAVILVAGATTLAVTMFDRSQGVAFAQVREQILQARTVAWTMTTTFDNPMVPEGQKTMTVTARCIFKKPGLMRQEQQHEGRTTTIMTANLGLGRCLLVMPAEKRAQVIEFGDLSGTKVLQEGGLNMIDQLKEAIAGSERPLGKKEVDGRQAVGYRVREPTAAQPVDADVWADAETGDILRIEMAMSSMTLVMSDFTFNEEYDDALFSIEPPEGYAVTKTDMKIDDLCEQDLLDGLRFLAENNNSVFPEQLTVTPEIVRNITNSAMKHFKQVKQDVEQGRISIEEVQAQSQAQAAELQRRIMRLMMFINTVPGDSWHYNGSGVKYGDARTPLCWYKPEGAELYHVIYGNLGVADVAESDLPEAPEDEAVPPQPPVPESSVPQTAPSP